MIDDAGELRAWLRLLETPRLSRRSLRQLLTAFGSPEAVLAADGAARSAVIGPARAAPLDEPAPPHLAALIDATLAWLDGSGDGRGGGGSGGGGGARRILTVGDPHYPPALLQTADPPLLLHVQGRVELLAQVPSIAIVGSRNPTPQGAHNAHAFGRHLAEAGFVVVSGMALGIDTAAHEGALAAGHGRTIAVVGTGLDRVYPKRNLALARQIADGGAIVSEFTIGTPPLGVHFLMRNRIIAGLTQGTLVVEAALKSGSLSTARMALEADREVFAVPGSIHSPQARGCHALIRQGAKLVESASDILEELRLATGAGPAASLSGAATATATATATEAAAEAEAAAATAAIATEPAPEAAASSRLLAALGFDPASLDTLAGRTGRSAAELQVQLLELELDGRVARLPGQLYQRVSTPG